MYIYKHIYAYIFGNIYVQIYVRKEASDRVCICSSSFCPSTLLIRKLDTLVNSIMPLTYTGRENLGRSFTHCLASSEISRFMFLYSGFLCLNHFFALSLYYQGRCSADFNQNPLWKFSEVSRCMCESYSLIIYILC